MGWSGDPVLVFMVSPIIAVAVRIMAVGLKLFMVVLVTPPASPAPHFQPWGFLEPLKRVVVQRLLRGRMAPSIRVVVTSIMGIRIPLAKNPRAPSGRRVRLPQSMALIGQTGKTKLRGFFTVPARVLPRWIYLA